MLPEVLAPTGDPDPDADRVKRSRRDWIVDSVFFAVALATGMFMAGELERSTNPSNELLFFDLVGGVIACCLLWLRRRWPAGVALTIAALGAFSSFASGAGLIALFSLAVHRRFPIVLVVTVLGLLTLPIYLVIHPEDNEPWWLNVLFVLAVTGGTIAWGMFVRARRQLVLSLHERANRAEAEQQLRVEQGRQQERARIAREMHDVLAHRISLLSMHAGALEFRPDAPPEEIARAAGVVRASAHQALQDLREVIGVLREDQGGGDPERPQPTLEDLPGLLDESRAVGMNVSSECRVEDLAEVPAGVGRNAYRIVQEGLTNARKHAPGTAVTVSLTGAAGTGLSIEVRNPWPLSGAPGAIPGTGTGLIGLAERATLAGGRLTHGRTADGDFALTAWLPWPA